MQRVHEVCKVREVRECAGCGLYAAAPPRNVCRSACEVLWVQLAYVAIGDRLHAAHHIVSALDDPDRRAAIGIEAQRVKRI